MGLIKKGNTKIHKSCGIFNLPTHVCAVQCPGCYARRPELFRPNVLPARERNLAATKEPDFVARMVDEIHCAKIGTFRFHESGDFYSQSYVESWERIAAWLPGVKFYGYTKANHLDFYQFEMLPNVNLIRSVTPIGPNYGDAEHVARLQEMGYFLCPCKKGSKTICMLDCRACLDNLKVCFLQH
jgi:Gene product 88